jgi:chemotaxis protein histidine kinase CheA
MLSMDFTHVSNLLKKMNRIVDTLKDANIEVSGIEQELLLSYVKELHNVISGELKNGQNGHSSNLPDQKETVKPASDSPVLSKNYESETPQPKPSLREFSSEAKEIKKPVAVDLVENKELKEASAPEPSPEPSPESSPEISSEAASKSEVSSETMDEQVPPKLKSIFEIKNSNELSDKLSFSPIKDLRKSMGVNERIFTINELFGGDQKLFDDVFQHLNTIDNYDDAAEYLIERVAIPNSWQDGERKKKAEQFVKLVYRRYL